MAVGNASAFDLDALDTRIKELVAYARERDGEDRTLLFRNLVDLFLTGKAPKKQPTRGQLLDVIEALIPHVEPDGRRTVAELVANLSTPPLDLAYRLAKDRPHIVEGLLRSAAFDENDIINLIASTGRDHHHVIASRGDLSANVWIALARAAPSAPPFDNPSTLALWRDDLGGEHSDKTVTPFRTTHGSTDTAYDPGSSRKGDHPDATEPRSPELVVEEQLSNSATTNHGDTRHAAELRILRTDKDLIADRIEKSDEKMQTAQEIQPKPTEPVAQEPLGRPSISLPSGQGKWSWQSDRDGLVLCVSENGAQLYPRAQKLIENSALELLGLGNKLGHPVSRAFQRRSPIHDAPIALDNDDIKLRFWTLEATPVFSANNGIFEGYDGVMTPMSAHEQPGLSLPDQAPETARTLHAIIDENIDRTAVPAPEQISPKQAPPAPVGNSHSNQPLAHIASEVLKDLIGDSVAAALSNNLRERQAELAKARTADDQSRNDLGTTLHILEETLANLIAAGKSSGNISLRLQTEIATACLKTLKDQLADK